MEQRPEVSSAALSPTRAVVLIRRVSRPMFLRIGLAAVLEVPGRRTGTPLHVTLLPVEIDGTWYLMAFGGVTDWVRNLRAAGRGDLRRKGRTQTFNAIEVEGHERDLVIAAYRAKLPKPVKSDLDRLPGPADHPTFRLEPIS